MASSTLGNPASAASPSIDVGEYAKNYLAVSGRGFTPGGPVVVRLIRPTGAVVRTETAVAWEGRFVVYAPVSSCDAGPANLLIVEAIDVVSGQVDRLTANGCEQIGVRKIA
jgi:hypothetical protein